MSLVPDQLRLMARAVPDETAFVDLTAHRDLTFGEWEAGSNRVGRGLVSLGVEAGDRVALFVGSTCAIDWVVAYAAIHKAGAVAVPSNERYAAPELSRILDHSGAAAVLTDDVLTAVAREASFALRRPPVLVPLESLGGGDGSKLQVRREDGDIADILYTSGTTGVPKGVVVRHSNASILPTAVPRWTGSGWLSSSPLFTFAGITSVYTPMRLGMTSLHLAPFDSTRWIEAVERERPAMVFLVPAMAELLLADPLWSSADLSSVELCAVGSAPLPPAVQHALQRRMPGAAVSNAYSMTEAGTAYTILPKDEAERRRGSVGRPIPPSDFFVVDDKGASLPPGKVGELVISIPGRQREYYKDQAATEASWREDGLHTGDLARVDEDGYVYVVGRKKDIIIRGGHNIYASDVENVLHEHPGVLEAAVAGVPHPVLGEDVAAWLAPAAGYELEEEELIRFVRERVAGYKVPRHVFFVRELPKNATGKVLKSELVATFEPSERSRGPSA